MTVWFITGASRGFGLEITREALGRGDSVVATARDPQAVLDAIPDADDRLLAVALDVGEPAQISAAVDAAIARFGRIDALINNAGRGLVGSVEETSDAEARAIFDVNVFGLLAITRAVLPHMRAQRSGLVVNLSSVGGFVAWPGWGVYAATKFAVEAISEAMTRTSWRHSASDPWPSNRARSAPTSWTAAASRSPTPRSTTTPRPEGQHAPGPPTATTASRVIRSRPRRS